MPLKFYTDSHIPKAVTEQLRARGVDIIRCQDVGMADAEDAEHLVFAITENRAIVTGDDDFLTLAAVLSRRPVHPGIFFIHRQLLQRRQIGAIVGELLFYAEAVEAGAATLEEDVYNHVIYVSGK